MSVAAKAETKPMSDAEIVEAYLTASMIPDPDAAAAYMKPGTIITFTGGREFDHRAGRPASMRALSLGEEEDGRFDVPGARRGLRSARCTANGSTARRSKATAMSTASWSGRVHRQDGCLERQRGTDSVNAGSRRRFRCHPRDGALCASSDDETRGIFDPWCEQRTRASRNDGPDATRIATCPHLRHLHHPLAAVFLGIGRQDIQQIAAALRRRRHQRAGCHGIQMAVHQAHHLGLVALYQGRDDARGAR